MRPKPGTTLVGTYLSQAAGLKESLLGVSGVVEKLVFGSVVVYTPFAQNASNCPAIFKLQGPSV